MEPEGKWIQYINRLTEIKAISVSPESAVNAFVRKTFLMNIMLQKFNIM